MKYLFLAALLLLAMGCLSQPHSATPSNNLQSNNIDSHTAYNSQTLIDIGNEGKGVHCHGEGSMSMNGASLLSIDEWVAFIPAKNHLIMRSKTITLLNGTNYTQTLFVRYAATKSSLNTLAATHISPNVVSQCDWVYKEGDNPVQKGTTPQDVLKANADIQVSQYIEGIKSEFSKNITFPIQCSVEEIPSDLSEMKGSNCTYEEFSKLINQSEILPS